MNHLVKKYMLDDLVSIIVPIYNAEKYINKCINSLLNQSYSNLEIILIDDGSTDASPELIDGYVVQDARVKVKHQRNCGVSAARNAGLNLATGEWIAFVDSDDTVDVEYIEKLLPQNLDVEMSLCGMTRIYQNGDTLRWRLYHDGRTNVATGIRSIEEVMTELNFYALTGPVCKLFRNSILKREQIRFPVDMSLGEDSVFVFSYLRFVQNVWLVGSWLYNYNSVENSLTIKADSQDKLLVAHRVYDLSLEICDRNRIENIDPIQYHYVDMLLQVIASEKKWMTRVLCYDDIAQLVGTKTVKQMMPVYFPLFAKWRKWGVYEWLTKKIYGGEK